jgi:hypothetical protein
MDAINEYDFYRRRPTSNMAKSAGYLGSMEPSFEPWLGFHPEPGDIANITITVRRVRG